MTKIFLHVPKTAGTSLLVALRDRLGDELVEYYDNQPGKTLSTVLTLAQRARIIFGHASFGIHRQLGVAPEYGTILRHPVARVISLYHFLAQETTSTCADRIRRGLTLGDFVRARLSSQTSNHMTQILAGRGTAELDDDDLARAKRNLFEFAYVGILEELNLAGLESFLGVGPIRLGCHNIGSYARDTVPSEDREIIESHNQYDLELYRYAVELLRSRDKRGRCPSGYPVPAPGRRPDEQRSGIAGRERDDGGACRSELGEEGSASEPGSGIDGRPSGGGLRAAPGRRLEGDAATMLDARSEQLGRAMRAAFASAADAAELQVLKERVRQQERLIAGLNAVIQEHHGRHDLSSRTLRDHESTIASLKSSTSWRLTAPLRWLKHAWRRDRPPPGAASGARTGFVPPPDGAGLFDAGFYLEQNPDVALLGISPLEHYFSCGAAEGRNPHPLFDTAFYRAQEPALPPTVNPLLHYCSEGVAARRDPSPFFSTGFYLDSNPDVRQAGTNPLRHFCEYGLLEGRWPSPRLRPTLPGGRQLDACSPEQAVRRLAARAKELGGEGPRLAAAKACWRQDAEAQLATFLLGASRLTVPLAERPRLSVILVLHNQAALTLDCLRSLAAGASAELETIIVDNNSTDSTAALLDRLEGVRILRNAENRGYAAAVNQGAAAARGELLLLLNNDAVLLPGTVAAAVGAVDEAADIGAVGGRVVLADGTLQEAGSIVWRDGSCLGYGRGDDPNSGEYRFRREVDYCSGVFLLIRRAAFDAVGGFDESFFPAYFEDVDFCVRLRERGYRILYEPEAELRHWEFASSTDRDRALNLQLEASPRFLAKHATWLAGRLPPRPSSLVEARSADRGRERILMIDDLVPHAWRGAGFPRALRLVRALSRGRFLTLYTTSEDDRDWRAIYSTLPGEVEVVAGSRIELAGFLLARQDYYDTILVSRPHNMQAFNQHAGGHPEILRRARLIYDAEAVFAVREMHAARLAGRALAAEAAEAAIAEEVLLARSADHILVVSAEEARYFRSQVRAPVTVLGHATERCPGSRRFEERRGLLFVGPLIGDGAPNVDALAWFVTEILPLIRSRIGPVELHVAGQVGSPRITALAEPGVHFHGVVQDLAELYDASRVFIAPTRFSAGIPLKVVEAAARGVPAVTTGLLAQQLGWRQGCELMAGDDAASFAAACAQLYQDGDLWRRLREGALLRIGEEHAPDLFEGRLDQALVRPHASTSSA
jgi:GT2 family glycosyltransferase